MCKTVGQGTRGAVCCLLFLVSLPRLSAQLEDTLYLVTDSRAELYTGRSLARTRLRKGEVVRATHHDTYRDWLRIRYRGAEYDVNAKFLTSRGRLIPRLAREVADLEFEAEELEERIQRDLRRADELYAAAVAIPFDSTVQYKIPLLRPLDATPSAGSRQGRPMPAPLGYQTVYRYRNRIDVGKARNQARRWLEEAEELVETVAERRKRRAEKLGKLARAETDLAYVKRRFRAFEATSRGYVDDLWITARNRAPLFDGKHLVAELRRDVIVRAVPNREFKDWLRVRYKKQILDSAAEYYKNRQEIDAYYGALLRVKRARVARQRFELDRLEAREQLLASASLDLDYESRVDHYPLRAYPFEDDFAGGRFYTPPATPTNATRVVNRSRARRLYREWEDDLEALRDDLADRRRKAGKYRRDLAEAESRYAEIRRRFAEADRLVP